MRKTHPVPRIVAACAVVGAHVTAAAQTDAEVAAAGRTCMTIESQELRLACFEGIFGIEPAPLVPAAVTAPAARTQPARTATAPAAQTSRTAPVQTPPEVARAASEATDGSADAPDIRVVEVREIRPGDARFLTEDGRVYYSTGRIPRNARLPEAPFTATLESGALGSQFLRFGAQDYERVRVSERD